ncbi:MAG: recombinase family protein [Lachnospiraceae bacterium]|nr:recombinase family protein [Lachnospiraceae bacterium]
MQKKQIVRMLLRVSSNQQLEADGDLSVQRRLVMEYISRHSDWELDKKEYFEGSKSGYKTAVSDRDTLQEAMEDARKREYDILVAYKDDRIGRRMWEIGAYVMTLKNYGVDIYTVKDGCISPEGDDIMGQMMLALRFGNAQKSSSDTGMRVKDTAQKLVQQGKFMGGCAPYGYELVLSGELSKHGRALHQLKIIPEQAEVVRYIYNLSLNKEYGSSKIAKVLNEDEYYKTMAPRDVWKSGTITSILTNPVYAGHVSYKRRERINGKYHRLDSGDWIKSFESDGSLQIIDADTWDRTQHKRKIRADKYIKTLENKGVKVMRRNGGMLSLIDVIYCGYCGRKLTNGTKYNYWTIKETGERRASKTPIYRCQSVQMGIPHDSIVQFRADKIEKIVFDSILEYIQKLQEKEDIFEVIEKSQNHERKVLESEIRRLEKEIKKITGGIETMEGCIPQAISGTYPLSIEELASAIRRQKEKAEEQKQLLQEKKSSIREVTLTTEEWIQLKAKIPTWQQVFQNADAETQRVLVNKLVDRIDVTDEQIVIRFKLNLSDFLPRISGDSGTTPYKHGSA